MKFLVFFSGSQGTCRHSHALAYAATDISRTLIYKYVLSIHDDIAN
jgi:hypothetical protein